MMNYADDFRRLAERFRRADNDSEAIKAACMEGSRLLQRVHETRVLEFSIDGLKWPSRPTRRTMASEAQVENALFLLWPLLVDYLARMNPDRFGVNINRLKCHSTVDGVSTLTMPATGNRARSENYAIVCERIAEHCEEVKRPPAYLGVILDEDRSTITRVGFSKFAPIELSKLSFALLRLLVDAGPNGVSKTMLDQLPGEPDSRRTALTTLRRVVNRLGVTITDGRSGKNRVLVDVSKN